MLISIIIPVFNRSELLKEALYSVFNQTYKDFEVIVVDDGSTEDIESVCKNFNLRYFKIKHSGLPSIARNFAVKKANGEFIAFLDSDDLWLESKLQKQVDFFKSNNSIKIVHTKEVWKRGEKIISQKNQTHKKSGDIFLDALKKCTIGPSTVLLKKSIFELVGGFDETIEVAEDYELWLRITANYNVGYIDEPLIIKRAGDWEQLSEKYGQIEKFRVEALLKLLDKNFITGEKYNQLLETLKTKAEIYKLGLLKREKKSDIEELNQKLKTYFSI